ncbi:VOC family protein [uncultured Psychroserpens sp.]|uniref:VOC family protein n=1 Tax=uncultured Psychroserpens sp. TaxID=255436 RepID=UPI003453D2AE
MNSIAPQFIVKNVLESVQFYTKKLGFDINWMHKKDPKFAILEKGGATIMFQLQNQFKIQNIEIRILR